MLSWRRKDLFHQRRQTATIQGLHGMTLRSCKSRFRSLCVWSSTPCRITLCDHFLLKNWNPLNTSCRVPAIGSRDVNLSACGCFSHTFHSTDNFSGSIVSSLKNCLSMWQTYCFWGQSKIQYQQRKRRKWKLLPVRLCEVATLLTFNFDSSYIIHGRDKRMHGRVTACRQKRPN